MKIAPKAAEGFLGAPSREYGACLLYGPDSGLVRERAKTITKSILAATDDPFALAELTEAKIISDPALLADELASISMLSSKRIILIRDAGDKLTKIIEAAATQFHPGVFLIVCADELSARSSLRGWFEKDSRCAALADDNVAQFLSPDESRDVAGVVRKAFEAAGIRADRDVTEFLSQQLGNDRYVTHQELDKLVTYAGETKQLTLAEVRELVDYNREANLDDIVNAVADRNVQALDAMLSLLLREGAAPVAYLRALQRYFNRLYLLRAQIACGQSVDQALQALRPPVFFRQLPILTRHLHNWNSTQVIKALKLLTTAELACKTSDLPALSASSRKLFQVTQIR